MLSGSTEDLQALERYDRELIASDAKDEKDNAKSELLLEEKIQASQQRVKRLIEHDTKQLSWWRKKDNEPPLKWFTQSTYNLRYVGKKDFVG